MTIFFGWVRFQIGRDSSLVCFPEEFAEGEGVITSIWPHTLKQLMGLNGINHFSNKNNMNNGNAHFLSFKK